MSIRRGADWGRAVRAGAGARVAGGDAELAAVVGAAGGPVEPGGLIVTGGDLHRTLGGPERRDLSSDELVAFEVDLVRGHGVRPDGSEVRLLAVAHVVGLPVSRRRGVDALWRGPSFVAANAAFLGEANIGPRAHPGDGLLDVSWGELPRRDRRAARARMLTGSHLPHPAIEERRTRSWSAPPDSRYVVLCDGVEVGELRDVRLTVEPDAVVVAV